MARVRGKNTAPELAVRSILHKAGYRFRLHRKDLPGTPDIVLPKFRAVVFVHGCFWHQHPGCKHSTRPGSRQDYWQPKLDRNIARDKRDLSELAALGWKVLVVWECETRDTAALSEKLVNFLEEH